MKRQSHIRHSREGGNPDRKPLSVARTLLLPLLTLAFVGLSVSLSAGPALPDDSNEAPRQCCWCYCPDVDLNIYLCGSAENGHTCSELERQCVEGDCVVTEPCRAE